MSRPVSYIMNQVGRLAEVARSARVARRFRQSRDTVRKRGLIDMGRVGQMSVVAQSGSNVWVNCKECDHAARQPRRGTL